jgi:hypothetical protein
MSDIIPKILLILIIGGIGVQTIAANLAVLEVVISECEDEECKTDEITVQQTKLLTDELRKQAVLVLPTYTVYTREKIIELAKDIPEGVSNLVDIGRAIKSDYVTHSTVGFLDGSFVLTVELYNCENGILLSNFVETAPDTKGLLKIIHEKSNLLFEKILPPAPPPPPVSSSSSITTSSSSSEDLKIGIIAKIGFAKIGVKNAKSDMAYSLGFTVIKNFGILDFAPEILLSSEEYEISEKRASKIGIEIPLAVRLALAKGFGISLGAVADIPLSLKIENEAPKDIEKFGIAAMGGLYYAMTENIFIEAVYEKYFNKTFTSLKNSNTDKALCGIGYLF